MPKRNKILIPLEFIADCKNQLMYGVELGKALNMELLLIHTLDVYQEDVYFYNEIQPSILPPKIKERKEASEKAIQSIINEVKKEYKELPKIDYTLEIGFYSDQLVKAVNERDVGIVLLINNEENDFIDKIIGNMNQVIAEEVDIPVLIVPETLKFKPYKKILYATDYTREDIEFLGKLVKLFCPFNPLITALHITDDMDFEERIKQMGFMEEIKERVQYENIEILRYPGEDVPETLSKYADQNKNDLIVMLKENRSFWEKLMKSSESKKMINKAQRPLLIFHEPEK